MREVGVEGHGVAVLELVSGAAVDEADRPSLDDRSLAAARLVHGRVVGAGGRRTRRERVKGHLGAESWERRREHLVAVRAAATAAPFGRSDHAHALRLVEPKELREA